MEDRESPLNLENSIKDIINYFELCLSAYEYTETGKYNGKGFLESLSALENLNKLYKTYHELPSLNVRELPSKVKSFLNILKNEDYSNSKEKNELILVCKSLMKYERQLFLKLNPGQYKRKSF